jgi:DNA gyrase subunit A
VKHTTGDDEVVIATHDGRAVRFKESDARVMGRTARGVRGIKMNEDDYVVGVAIVDETKKLITLTEKGYGKRNDFDTYNARNRGTKGVICQKTSEKTGALAGIAAVGENDDIMIITNDGTIIRTPVSGIPVYEGNNTSGVIIMRLSGDAKIISFAAVKSEEEEAAEIEAAVSELKTESVEVKAEEFPLADEDEI